MLAGPIRTIGSLARPAPPISPIENFRNLEASPRGHVCRRLHFLQGIERRAYHVDGVAAADRLADRILHTEPLQHRANRTAGNDAGPWWSRTKDHPGGAEPAARVMVQRTPLAKWDADESSLGVFRGLAYCLGNLLGLARTESNPSLAVTDNDDCGKPEATSTLDYLGHPANLDQVVGKLLTFLRITLSARHTLSRSGAQNPRPPSRAASANARTRP